MSKYKPLWEFVKKDRRSSFILSFDEIKEIIGMPIDHSFLNFKNELPEYGFKICKISLKEQNVSFLKVEE